MSTPDEKPPRLARLGFVMGILFAVNGAGMLALSIGHYLATRPPEATGGPGEPCNRDGSCNGPLLNCTRWLDGLGCHHFDCQPRTR